MKVAGKVIVVTGAGNGMGRAISLNLLNKGAKVIGLDINMDGLKKTQELAGNNGNDMKLMQLDITNREAVEQAAEELSNCLVPLTVSLITQVLYKILCL